MIEIQMMRYLEAKLPDIPVSLEEPEAPPAAYIVIEKTGSSAANRILEATFAIRSYGATLYDALLLNDRVKAAMEPMGPEDGVFCARLNTDYPYTDTATKQHRYQAVYEIYY